MSLIRELIENIYRQDEYSLVYLLLIANALSLAVFLSRDAEAKSVPGKFNARERGTPGDLNKTPETPRTPTQQSSKKTISVVASGGIELPAPGKQVEQSQKEKVIDLEKVRSKPLVWRFPNN
ncbi:hypothetical protein SAMN05660826_01478 [Caldanaerovirga acetigignens]|uniref:Uncharacterized protein n=1 Tax=Caldanaerovirga acetigignens TaxID=447595 RepID=A0A1M7KAP8_9FIRM|nr:hypothetical protein [Caldanaerovirga acetigignens]SHM61927.1 hypothetical protein SAMN05660826_01478 [Caldanaerovirga acetigignens]